MKHFLHCYVTVACWKRDILYKKTTTQFLW